MRPLAYLPATSPRAGRRAGPLRAGLFPAGLLRARLLHAGLPGLVWAGFLCVGAPAASAQSAPGCQGTAGLPAAVKPGVYQGTVAGQDATLQLGENYRYFYVKQGLDIDLEVSQSAGQLLMQEGSYDPKAGRPLLRACFRLTPTSTGLNGTWTLAGRATGQAVSFRRVDASILPLRLPPSPGLLKLRRDDPYNFIKVNRAWPRTSAGNGLREPLSGLVYPRVAGESAALNAALQDRQLDLALNSLDCQSQPLAGAQKTKFTARFTQRFLTDKLFSFVDSVNYYCGGAHPDRYEVGVILDRLTGERLSLGELWPGFTGAQQHQSYLAALPATTPAECREVLKTRAEPAYTASLIKAGVRLVPGDLPHAVAACAQAVTVPYNKLKPYTFTGLRYYTDF